MPFFPQCTCVTMCLYSHNAPVLQRRTRKRTEMCGQWRGSSPAHLIPAIHAATMQGTRRTGSPPWRRPPLAGAVATHSRWRFLLLPQRQTFQMTRVRRKGRKFPQVSSLEVSELYLLHRVLVRLVVRHRLSVEDTAPYYCWIHVLVYPR